jgi:hypothetical protein
VDAGSSNGPDHGVSRAAVAEELESGVGLALEASMSGALVPRRLIDEASEVRDQWPRPVSAGTLPARAITLIDELAAVDVTNAAAFDALMDKLWNSLGAGEWLPSDDYEALRSRYNTLAEAAEDACTLYRRMRE